MGSEATGTTQRAFNKVMPVFLDREVYYGNAVNFLILEQLFFSGSDETFAGMSSQRPSRPFPKCCVISGSCNAITVSESHVGCGLAAG